MASEEMKSSSAVTKIVNLAEEAKLAKGEIKPSKYQVYTICKSLFAGGVAGGLSRTAVAPLERLKILLQVQNPHSIKYNGTIQGLKYIWRTEGVRGLFKGNGTNCARIVPNSAVKFFSYEQASNHQGTTRLMFNFFGSSMWMMPFSEHCRTENGYWKHFSDGRKLGHLAYIWDEQEFRANYSGWPTNIINIEVPSVREDEAYPSFKGAAQANLSDMDCGIPIQLSFSAREVSDGTFFRTIADYDPDSQRLLYQLREYVV